MTGTPAVGCDDFAAKHGESGANADEIHSRNACSCRPPAAKHGELLRMTEKDTAHTAYGCETVAASRTGTRRPLSKAAKRGMRTSDPDLYSTFRIIAKPAKPLARNPEPDMDRGHRSLALIQTHARSRCDRPDVTTGPVDSSRPVRPD